MTSIIKVDTLQKANGATPTAADLGINTTGTVLQVVQGVGSTGRQVYTSTSYFNLITASITPKFSTSKILVSVHTSITRTSSAYARSKITRGSSDIYIVDTQTGYLAGNNAEHSVGSISGDILDSPNTTNSTTYALELKMVSSGSILVDGQPVITLMEIAG
jgi:hypothetical protein